MLKRAMIVATILVATLAWAQSTEMWKFTSGVCPLCETHGIAVPDRSQLADCQCEKWWRGHAPARLVFADCSHNMCVEMGPNAESPRIYVDLQLYRCPKCGLLFTEPDR